MPVQRSYNVWKTGIILTIKKYEEMNQDYPWCVVAMSKTIYKKDKIYFPIKILSKNKTYKEACASMVEVEKTINKHKFPR